MACETRHIAYTRFPITSLRCQPAEPLHRISVAELQVFPLLNPDGGVRPSRIVSSVYVTLENQFRVQGHVVRGPRRLVLEINPLVFDMARKQSVTLTFSLKMARDIHSETIKAYARWYAHSREGR